MWKKGLAVPLTVVKQNLRRLLPLTFFVRKHRQLTERNASAEELSCGYSDEEKIGDSS